MINRPADAPAKPQRTRLRPCQRRAPAPFDINWRMGYVGTVCFVDAHGESLRTVRYAAAACDDPRDLVVEPDADARKRQLDAWCERFDFQDSTVGSGVTESTCKTVFGHRTKRSGQRWRVPTLRGVVTRRALLQSDRLPRFWQRLSLHYAAHVEAA